VSISLSCLLLTKASSVSIYLVLVSDVLICSIMFKRMDSVFFILFLLKLKLFFLHLFGNFFGLGLWVLTLQFCVLVCYLFKKGIEVHRFFLFAEVLQFKGIF